VCLFWLPALCSRIESSLDALIRAVKQQKISSLERKTQEERSSAPRRSNCQRNIHCNKPIIAEKNTRVNFIVYHHASITISNEHHSIFSLLKQLLSKPFCLVSHLARLSINQSHSIDRKFCVQHSLHNLFLFSSEKSQRLSSSSAVLPRLLHHLSPKYTLRTVQESPQGILTGADKPFIASNS
jgi:hypothetical protein